MKNIIEYFNEEALTHDSNFITEMGMTCLLYTSAAIRSFFMIPCCWCRAWNRTG